MTPLLVVAGLVVGLLLGGWLATVFAGHEHSWVDEVTRYEPPDGDVKFKGHGYEAMRIIERLTFGQTVVRQRCEGCGATRAWTVAGDAREAAA